MGLFEWLAPDVVRVGCFRLVRRHAFGCRFRSVAAPGPSITKGNSVTYTLDNAGNKTGEQVKDPSGNLQRNITRVYDALNRVQQIAGASN